MGFGGLEGKPLTLFIEYLGSFLIFQVALFSEGSIFLEKSRETLGVHLSLVPCPYCPYEIKLLLYGVFEQSTD